MLAVGEVGWEMALAKKVSSFVQPPCSLGCFSCLLTLSLQKGGPRTALFFLFYFLSPAPSTSLLPA